MENDILLIPEKPDSERDAIATVWRKRGGEVLRIGKFWEKPPVDGKRIAIYGSDTFSLVLAQVVGVQLLVPKDDILCDIDHMWLQRTIEKKRIDDITQVAFPVFIKPVKPKTFASRVYRSLDEFYAEVVGLDSREYILLSNVLSIEKEVRFFVLDKKIMDGSYYEGEGVLGEPRAFAEKFLRMSTVELPKTFVLDVGFSEEVGWFVLECNASWGAGLNGCNAEAVVDCIREASVSEES